MRGQRRAGAESYLGTKVVGRRGSDAKWKRWSVSVMARLSRGSASAESRGGATLTLSLRADGSRRGSAHEVWLRPRTGKTCLTPVWSLAPVQNRQGRGADEEGGAGRQRQTRDKKIFGVVGEC